MGGSTNLEDDSNSVMESESKLGKEEDELKNNGKESKSHFIWIQLEKR